MIPEIREDHHHDNENENSNYDNDITTTILNPGL